VFRIRNVPDDTAAANAAAVRQVQDILYARFPGIDRDEVESLPAKLRDPFKQRFRPVLLVVEDERGGGGRAGADVRGFALILHAPDLDFCYLDYVATDAERGGRGLGGALYERVREEAQALRADGLYFECLPDDETLSPNPAIREENAARLRFYERYGARPITNTRYETPVEPGGSDPPYLVLDPLGHAPLPGREEVRKVVRAILERKYAKLCPPDYVDNVVESFRDDPVELRAPRYLRRQSSPAVRPRRRLSHRITLVVNDRHDIHHVRERGYVQAPVRVSAILDAIGKTDMFERIEPHRFPETAIRAVHDGRLVDYLRRACAVVGNGRSAYPYVFPIRNVSRPPKELPLRAGYFCIDTFTPINGNAWRAARRGVDCALTAAERVLEGQHLGYALVRPPGHHAERSSFGGFCYFNNAAISANYLSRFGRVAVLDIDYHHGNGTQDIFYERPDVLTVSIHGHPSFAYPYFSGFSGETGIGRGAGMNLNIPLPETITPSDYRQALTKALARVTRFAPDFLVVAAGFDTGAGDPTGSWANRGDDFRLIGSAIGSLGLPVLVVQEGGYRVRTLGSNARQFFEGLSHGAEPHLGTLPIRGRRRLARAPAPTVPGLGVQYRTEVRPGDPERIRRMTASSGNFSAEEEAIAAELIEEGLQRGEAAGYYYQIAERDGHLVGFAVYGPIPGTAQRFDLYWIVTHPDVRRQGAGLDLLERIEADVVVRGGSHLFVDTASNETYVAARAFYRACGYKKVAELPDFFRDGDGKVIFAKRLPAP
jgi:acetoin utilization deacetylase AcuC-like enzyme/ribosomal protein S18 acetylase RimI-like enzyme